MIYSKDFIGKGNPIMEMMFGHFVLFAFGEKQLRDAFEKQSGMKLPTGAEPPLHYMIDKATGHQDAVLTAFIEWCIDEHWGRKLEDD